MRKVLISMVILLSLLWLACMLGMFSDKYDRAVKETTKQLDRFFASMDAEELIVDSKDIDHIMEVIDDRFGIYFTDEFQESLRKEINHSLKTNGDYKENPEVFSFFLYNEGDGFRFAKGEFKRYAAWNTDENEVVHVRLVIDVASKVQEHYSYPIYTDDVDFVKEDGRWMID